MAMSDAVFLPSLQVEGFRGIRFLRIEQLGQVNLFVGKNNVGKTSLLEALRLYASAGVPQGFRDLFWDRGEWLGSDALGQVGDREKLERAIRGLFFGYFTGQPSTTIRIGPAYEAARTLSITFSVLEGDALANRYGLISGQQELILDPAVIDVVLGDELYPPITLERLGRRWVHPTVEFQNYAAYIPPGGISLDRLGAFWDRVVLTDREDVVVKLVRMIAPDVERISFVMEGYRREIVGKILGVQQPVPLRVMGDGVNRVLGIALALTNAGRGFLLIDEFENGLHYSIQADVWRAVFNLAAQLNVQVFATTHSYDCIRAFTSAANENVQVKGQLHRLEYWAHDELRSVDLSEEDLAIVTRQHIEVR